MLVGYLFVHPLLPLIVAFTYFTAICCANQRSNVTSLVHYKSGKPKFPINPPPRRAPVPIISPILATGQREYGVQSTISPDLTQPEYHRIVKIEDFPLPIPDVYIKHLEFPYGNSTRSRSTDLDTYTHIYNRGGGVLAPGFLDPAIDHSAGQAIEPAIEEGHVTTCTTRCRNGMFLCQTNCTCIAKELRCDGRAHCGNGEDENHCESVKDVQHEHVTIRCDESKNFTLCPKTGKCISKEWLCDGDNDCEDYSDETRCGVQHNCTSDQFQCENGLCIPKTWICDNDNDCRDSSDEINCTNAKCTAKEFECQDGSCIALNWKCDRHLDCIDGSDERQCDVIPAHCSENEFECGNQKCIKIDFTCDGDDDCDDWSDESNCRRNFGECGSGEFLCQNGECIPKRWVCDNQKDCSKEEDETNCDYALNKTHCNHDEFACSKGQCILDTWRCDGVIDCPKGEDEDNCEIVCDDASFPCTGPGPNDTKTFSCLRLKYRCDGQADCPNGDDEKNCPVRRDCEPGTKCEQRCVTYLDAKFGCACQNGYQLDRDGFTCNDIDECMYATDPVCSQTCNNTVGSFKCGCMTGYVLRPDLRTCKAVGASPTLLFANRIDIRQMSLSNSRYSLILKGLHNAISLDYHYAKQLIFWTDVSTDKIKRAAVNGTGARTIVSSGLESPGGIAVDWIHNLLFWTDSGTKRVEVSDMDGTHRVIIVSNELDKPRAIVVHPGEALIFWSDWGPNPKIERAEMDGSNRRSVINESVFWPNGLTLDYTDNQLYWADAKHNVIEAAQLDGSRRRKIVTKGLPHPFALTIFEDAIFWTDWHTKSIATANKVTGAGYKALHSYLHFPMDIHSYHPQRQPKFANRCGSSNGGCQHLCLPNRRAFSCVCRMGQRLKSDRKNCQTPETFLIFAKKKDIRIKHLDGSAEKQYETVIPLDGVKNAVSIAWDAATNYIYWTDVALKSINRAYWNGSDHQVIAHTNIVSPRGLAFDWISQKIYWTDFDASLIEVANADGSKRSLLIWENLDKPQEIVVDPNYGLMFWVDAGVQKRIERAHMDGSNRMVIVSSNITTPTGLAIDQLTANVYWVDSASKTINLAKFDGTERKILLGGPSLSHPYGLDVYYNYVYWTDWKTNSIQKAHKLTGKNRTTVVAYVPDPMGVKIFHRTRKSNRTVCNNVNNGGCSDLCLLKPKGYSCACPTGVTLEKDKKTCTNGPLNYLIMAHRMEIRQISLDVPYMIDVVMPFAHLKLATSVDVDRKTGQVYWTDTTEGSIQRADPSGKGRQSIITREIDGPDGIAIDSTGRKIYWTDADRRSIEVSELDGRHRKVLFNTKIYNPRAITLHYHHGLMFWSDWGKQGPKIEVAHMDGTNRRILISRNITWPNGLAIDRPEGRLYWNDAKRNTIESCDLAGRNRKLILDSIPHPYGLVVVGSHIYWTDWKTKALHRAEKETGREWAIIRGGLEGLMDVRSVQNDNIAENACGTNNGGCSHLCLRNPNGFTCACPTGLNKTDGHPKHCDDIPQTFLLVASRYSLSQISLDTSDAWDVTLPIKDDMQNVLDIDFHYKKKLVFYSDIGRNVIQSVNMYNWSEVRTVASENLSSPDGISVDWLANNIYWTNTGNRVIEVARLDGSSRKTIIAKTDDPRSLVCNPKAGYLYWSDWDPNKPRIERSYLDGTNRRIIVTQGLTFPIGLAIDFSLRRLYWVDAKLSEARIESSDYNGFHRMTLPIDKTHPFSLTQYREWVFWTDWDTRSVLRAEKINGNGKVLIRPMYAVMGISMVSQERQPYWNPCAVNNGNCTDLCLYKKKNYVCACPDEARSGCNTVPSERVSNDCPEGKGYDCDSPDDSEYIDYFEPPHLSIPEDTALITGNSTFYLITLVPMLAVIIASVTVVVYLLLKKGKKNYIYGASRSFSNPNYYSNDPNHQHQTDRKQFIWKRLKYDKSQERVYEETVVASPEVTSLIPTILTPCSSNCEAVTPEMERSPSVTPLHKVDIQ